MYLLQTASNEEVCARIQQAFGPHEDLTIVKRRKLKWYGHVSRSSGLAKFILQGTVKGGRRQGRQRKRWEDNIREWTGLEFGKSQKVVENGEKCGKPVVKSSVVPQRPPCLRDRWWRKYLLIWTLMYLLSIYCTLKLYDNGMTDKLFWPWVPTPDYNRLC